MQVQEAYDQWASQYDTNHNRTRDLEARSLRETLDGIAFTSCLEIGCGTGKNTIWLAKRAAQITSVDLSEGMLAQARLKSGLEKVEFIHADIQNDWAFTGKQYNLVVFSLVLEHIARLEPIFNQASRVLEPGGHVYIGELHPFKQYTGTRARFDTEAGQHVVECYTHHVSHFVQAAQKHGLALKVLNEYFDDGSREQLPRVLTLLFEKS